MPAEAEAADRNGTLFGSRCPKCGIPFFPARKLCAACGSGNQEALSLPRRGTVYVSTVIHVRPPAGYPSPYAVGYVELDGLPLMIPACFGSRTAPLLRGTRVELESLAPWYGAGDGPAGGPAYVFSVLGGEASSG